MSDADLNRFDCEKGELAALFAVGALDRDEARKFEKHAAECASCGRDMQEMQETAALLALASSKQPPNSLRRRVLEQTRPHRRAALVRVNEGAWIRSPFPGVEVKTLYSDPVTGDVTSLLRVRPGAQFPAHEHAGMEHVYVLEGDVVFDDHTLYAGDYEIAPAESRHSAVTTNTGCVILLINNRRDHIIT